MKTPPRMPDVVVVGGGFAGLAAATALVASGRTVKVLESGPTLGGRARSYKDARTGDAVDNGQHAFLGAYVATKRFLARIGALRFVHFQRALAIPFRTSEARFLFSVASLPAPLHLLGGLLGFKGLTFSERFRATRVGASLSFGGRPGEMETVSEWLTRLGQAGAPAERLWNPLATASVNESPENASASLFAEVLRRAFLGRAEDSVMGLSRAPLSDLYVNPAVQYLSDRGTVISVRSRAVSLMREGKRVAGVELESGEKVRSGAVVLAVPPPAAARLVESAGLAAPWKGTPVERASPILSIHLWYDRDVIGVPDEVTGLWDSPVQWVFDRGRMWGDNAAQGRRLSLVVSDSRTFSARSTAEVVKIATTEIAKYFPRAAGAALRHAAVRKEPNATFAGSPAAQRHRPRPATEAASLFLAGDWTATGLPGTIEGACLSAEAAIAAMVP